MTHNITTAIAVPVILLHECFSISSSNLTSVHSAHIEKKNHLSPNFKTQPKLIR